MTVSTLTAGTPLDLQDSLDSTSLEAKRRIASGTASAGWIMARRQTAGYGRRGRGWAQDEGDLAATLIHPLEGRLAANPALAGFALSLALAEALDASGVAREAIALKWPNDVLLSGGKVSGILLEREEAADSVFLCLGIGVNIVSRPDLPDYPTARVADSLIDAPAPEALLDRIDLSLTGWLKRLEEEGFAPIREAWLARARGLGQPITVRLPSETLDGLFAALDETGALLLRQGDVTRRIDTGDVFFPAGYASNAR